MQELIDNATVIELQLTSFVMILLYSLTAELILSVVLLCSKNFTKLLVFAPI
jgi:hypothetical protein